LPTPAAPDTTTPESRGAAIAASMCRISPDRPVSGHRTATPKA
jgi:hypothetical protein